MISIAVAFPAGIIGFFLIPVLLGESRQEYLLFSQIYFLVFLPITFLAQNFLALEQGEFRFQQFNGQRIVQAIAYPTLLLLLWLTGILSVKHAAIAMLSGTVFVALIRIWYARTGLLKRPSLHEASKLLALGIRLHIANVVMFLSMQVDKMVLILWASNTELGLYVVAFAAAGAISSLFVQTYINIMLPTAAKLGKGQEGIEDIVTSLRRLVGIICLTTMLLILIMPSLIVMVYGKDFKIAGGYAQILVLGSALIGIKQTLVYLLRSWRSNRPAILGEGLAAFIMIVGAYLVIKVWGTMGLCILVVVAHGAGTVLVGQYFLKETGLTLRQVMPFSEILYR
jgi:O-antigen/teichoic acid export membrane protein